jgi:flagellar hook-associated protein 1 FlgK
MSILSILHVGAGAMLAQQQAVQTVGHNLSNVDTPGYARQRVNLATAFPVNKGLFFLGMGVNVTGVTGIVDSFMEAQLVGLKANLGSAEAEHRALAGVADAFPVTEQEGIGPALEAFWGALSALANNPGGQAERVNLVGRARTLGDILGQTRTALTDVQTHLDRDLDTAVRRVNVILPQIASLV